MVSSEHEARHRIFQDRPELLTPVFRILGVPLAAKMSVEVLSPDVTEICPLERRIDTVLRVEPSDGDAFVLAIEPQRRREPTKGATWTYYLAFLAERYKLPALLLVVCSDRATAAWAHGPFDTGLKGWTALRTRPMVLGPDNLPVITDPAEAARDVTLATFAAMAHSRDRGIRVILQALAEALGSADQQSTRYLSEMLEIGLGDTPARAIWKEMIKVKTFFPGRGTTYETYYLAAVAEGEAKGLAEGKAEGLAEGEAEGLAKGKAEAEAGAVLRLLSLRKITVPDAVRERITGCTDLPTLERWFDRAIAVTTAEDLFAEE
jgi:hypothetical protein